jgi:predicted PurR-regulated permease PerM
MDQTIKTFTIITGLILLFIVIFIGLGDALLPLLFAFGLSYLTFPLIKRLEGKGIKRSITVPTILGVIIIVTILTIGLIVPKLVSDAHDFLKELPSNSALALEKAESLSSNLGYSLDLSKESITLYLKEHVSDFSGGLLKGVTQGLKSSFSGVINWVLAIINIFLVPLFFFYVINGFEKITLELKSFIPKSLMPKITHYFTLCNDVLSGYIRGQLMVALALACLYATGLGLVGLRFGILIGIISGLISIIPYAGFSIGFVTALTIALANYTGIGLIIGIVSVFIVVQTLESILITPKLVGDKVGLSALATMLALIIGGNLLGLVGMLIAIPIAAVSKTFIIDLKSEYQELDFYKK